MKEDKDQKRGRQAQRGSGRGRARGRGRGNNITTADVPELSQIEVQVSQREEEEGEVQAAISSASSPIFHVYSFEDRQCIGRLAVSLREQVSMNPLPFSIFTSRSHPQNKNKANYKLPRELFGISGPPLLPLELEWDVMHSEINCCQYFLLDHLLVAAERGNFLQALIRLLREIDIHTATTVCKIVSKQAVRVRIIGRQARRLLEIFPYITNTLLEQVSVSSASAEEIKVRTSLLNFTRTL